MSDRKNEIDKRSRVSLYLPPDLKNFIQKKARKKGISLNALLTILIENECKKEKEEEK